VTVDGVETKPRDLGNDRGYRVEVCCSCRGNASFVDQVFESGVEARDWLDVGFEMNGVGDPYNLMRFEEAQGPVYARVCEELRAGEKQSHWMWFIFPQIRGLGRSPMAKRFAIGSLEEARAYLAHSVLGPRLRECTALVNGVEGRTASEIFGFPDDLKFCSSMTLFATAGGGAEFVRAIEKYFGEEMDAGTLERI
jgi:uncharacterized protein (DUF1810 family)